ncbi:MAG TPA: hypothetical protein VJP02_11145 [Candidatus Sulfotelmatobacter sp.]|nr:hypothetical protein [Candidatus Sulfotelmatobacter sp.]
MISRFIFGLVTTVLLCAVWAVPQETPPTGGVPVKMLVTAESRNDKEVAAVHRDDVMVYQGHDRDKVADWVPAKGDHSGLELFVLIDDESNSNLGLQLDDVRHFIQSQAATTMVGVAYMGNGTAQILQNLTTDHALAAKALRLPLEFADINGSPYFSLGDLIRRWPESSARREVLMISSGIDYFGGSGPADPYVDSQIYLSRVCEEAGGESYGVGFFGPPVSFRPYLDGLSHHLDHQYWLTFLAVPGKKSGLQPVRLTTEVPNLELVGADSVYVPAQP